jgi:carboxylate-amine ligase
MTTVEQESREHRFGSSPTLSLGVEEELLLVDDARRLAPAAEDVIEAVGQDLRGWVSTEIFATQIELKTGICSDSGQALAELAHLRRVVAERGFGMIAAGLHPDDPEEPELVDSRRYEVVKEDLASLLTTPPCGLHVHVGMPDPETAVRVCNALRHHLPLLQALTANSPFRQGEDTGLASARAAVVASYPRFEMPRAFRDYEDFLRVADQLIAAAGVGDYTYLWWDLRPHPNLGTVEVRGMDVQTEVGDNAAIAALIQALAAKEVERPDELPGLCREALEESYFQAGRHGLEARLMVDDENAAPAREVAARVLEEVRPYARRLGAEGPFERIERIVAEGNGADVQRRAHAKAGIEGLLEDLAARTLV